MAKPIISAKRLAIDKSNTRIVIVVGVAAFVSVFSLVAAHAVLGQNEYQARVISASQKAHAQLVTNLQAVTTLNKAYATFNGGSTNLINGQTAGTGQNDGSNAKLILDALPSTYDFPALTSSLEQILNSSNYTVTGISGTDEQLTQQANLSSASPVPVSMPFTVSIDKANYASVQALITTLQNSIRPIQIDSIDLSGAANDMTMNVTAHTYYQPGKKLNISSEAIQ